MKRLRITFSFVNIYLLNGYWELKSFEEPCEWQPFLPSLESSALRGWGAYYVIHRGTISLYHNSYIYICIYIYIYIRGSLNKKGDFAKGDDKRYCLHLDIFQENQLRRVLLSFRRLSAYFLYWSLCPEYFLYRRVNVFTLHGLSLWLILCSLVNILWF